MKKSILILVGIIIIAIAAAMAVFFGNWKTYTNSEQGFSLKYPKEFIADENSDYPGNGDAIVTFRRSSFGDWSLNVGGGESYLEAVKNYPFKDKNNFQQNLITVAGKQSQEFSYVDKNDRNIEKITVYIPKDNGQYIYFDWKSSEDISESKKVQNSKDQFLKILSSFKFTK